jgi:hypothetical protein
LVFVKVEAKFAHLRIFDEEADALLLSFSEPVPLGNAFDCLFEEDVGIL